MTEFRQTAAIEHVDDILALDGADLINAAYLTLLGRAPDPEGMRHYSARLRSGWDKASVLATIAASSEARACRVELPGLPEFVAEQGPVKYWIWRLATRRRRIQSQMNRLERALGRLARQITRLEHSLATVPKSPRQDPLTLPDAASPDMSPSAERVFKELCDAVERAKQERKT